MAENEPRPIEKTQAAAADPTKIPSFTGTLAKGVHVVGGMGIAPVDDCQQRLDQPVEQPRPALALGDDVADVVFDHHDTGDTGDAGRRIGRFGHRDVLAPDHAESAVREVLAEFLDDAEE